MQLLSFQAWLSATIRRDTESSLFSDAGSTRSSAATPRPASPSPWWSGCWRSAGSGSVRRTTKKPSGAKNLKLWTKENERRLFVWNPRCRTRRREWMQVCAERSLRRVKKPRTEIKGHKIVSMRGRSTEFYKHPSVSFSRDSKQPWWPVPNPSSTTWWLTRYRSITMLAKKAHCMSAMSHLGCLIPAAQTAKQTVAAAGENKQDVLFMLWSPSIC